MQLCNPWSVSIYILVSAIDVPFMLLDNSEVKRICRVTKL